jgi:hypothetical protein
MLKNSDFPIDHNSGDRTQASTKITQGPSQETTFGLGGCPMLLRKRENLERARFEGFSTRWIVLRAPDIGVG